MENFSLSGLRPEIIRAVTELGFVTPTPVQQQTIPFLLENTTDLVALAQTGTGKTAAFGLPILDKIDSNNRLPQVLVLSPTRELCMQIASDMADYSKYLPQIPVVAVYGGESIERQLGALKRGALIIAGTPGRTLDLIKRKKIDTSQIRWLVLDEADEMLNMGFRDELEEIINKLPETRQTLLFSATMPPDVKALSGNYLKNPHEIQIGERNKGSENVSHQYTMVHASDKFEALRRLIDVNPGIYGIVFCRTRTDTKSIGDKLMQLGFSADALHGDLSQAQRDYVMNRFRLGHLKILVATDVAARGLDVTGLTHIINFELPDDPEIYIHRTGRTGRAGATGTAISIIHTRETRRLRDIARFLGREITNIKVPDGMTICRKQLFNLATRIETADISNEQADSFMEEIIRKLEWIDHGELIRRFMALEFNRMLEHYSDSRDINLAPIAPKSRNYEDRPGRQGDRRSPMGDRGDRRSGRDSFQDRDRDRDRDRGPKRQNNKGMSILEINVGSRQGVSTKNLLSLINQNLRDRGIQIGDIFIDRQSTRFEIEKRAASILAERMSGSEFGGVTVFARFADDYVPAGKPAEKAERRKKKRQ